MADVLTISELISRHIQVEWQESVAIVRELIDTYTAGNPPGTALPTLDEIYLTAAGQVDFSGRSASAEPHRWAGGVLRALLAHAEPPVQLRLVAMQATDVTPTLTTLAELNDALAYFERPNRPLVLQALYARAAVAPTNLLAPPAVLVTTAPPQPPAAKQKQRAERVASAKKTGRAVAIVLVVAACAAAGVWYAVRLKPVQALADSAVVARATDALGSAVLSGVSAITETAGFGRLVPPDATPGTPPAPGPTPSDIRLPNARVRRAETPVIPEFLAFDLAPPPGVLAPLSPPPVQPDGSPEAVAEPSLDDPEAVYSPDSEGVQPPIGIRPQLARQLPSNMREDELARVELVIAMDGSVESARLLDPPQDVIDSMIVSAAKAWSFEPALKDGRPVRYRKTVWVRSN